MNDSQAVGQEAQDCVVFVIGQVDAAFIVRFQAVGREAAVPVVGDGLGHFRVGNLGIGQHVHAHAVQLAA